MLHHYTARCHCGQLRFAFRAPKITTAVRCNCSICIRKGALMSSQYIPAADFTPIADSNLMYAYRWNDRVIDHLFCKVCGIYPYHGDREALLAFVMVVPRLWIIIGRRSVHLLIV